MSQLLETRSTQLPSAWVDRIFDRMQTFYGAKFAEQWRGLDPDRLKLAWAEELAGLSGDELKRGLEACKSRQWPPTLPEFITLCRPTIDPRVLWMEAVEQMRIRLHGDGKDVWSSPRVYWAAVKIGNFDLQQLTWEQVKSRWMQLLDEAKDEPIPEYKAALPAPGQTTTSREEASQRLHEIAKKTGVSIAEQCEPNTRWAVRLAEREVGGEDMSIIQKKLWRDALGVTMATSAKDALGGMEKAA